MRGKERCKILKEIRQKIADENGIEFITSECKHKGDCRGTCPKCESEVRYLERELEKKQRLGKSIAVAGIAASLVLTGVSCADDPAGNELDGDIVIEETAGIMPEPENPDEPLMGEPEEYVPDVPYIDENGNEVVQPMGDIAVPGELPDYFFPADVKEYDDYSQEFIDASMAGMSIDDVKAAWGEEDMNQQKDGRGIIAYFTDVHDIVIQYDVDTGLIINVATIENDG